MRFRTAICLSTHPASFQALSFKGDVESNIERIASFGYDGVELAVRDPALVDGDLLLEAARRHGLAVPAVGTGQAWGEERLCFTSADPEVRRRAIERMRSHMPLARKLGALVLVGLIRGAGDGTRSAAEHARLVSGLKTIAEAAARYGVRLALEPLNRYETSLVNTVEQGLELLEEVGAGCLGLLLDTFHMNIEERSMEAAIAACGGRVVHFHVADSNRLHPGAGHLDFGSVLTALLATGYEGYVSGEFQPGPDPMASAELALRHLRGLEIG